jgi:hypothetical protein
MSEKEPLKDIRGWEVKLVLCSSVIIGAIIGFTVVSIPNGFSQAFQGELTSEIASMITLGSLGGAMGFLATMQISIYRCDKHALWRERNVIRLRREVDEENRLIKLRKVEEAQKQMEAYTKRIEEEKHKKIEEERHLANARIEGVVERL